MNHYVPDFEIEEDYSIPTSSGLTRSKKSAMAEEEEIMELLWQNGQVVMQSQNQRSSSLKKSEAAETSSAREIRSEAETTPHLFMQEDEMASWLHYPLDDSSFDRELYADLLYLAPCASVTASASNDVRHPPPVHPRPPIPPPKRYEVVEGPSGFQNFMHFSRTKGRVESGPSCSSKAVKEMTVVGSKAPESSVSNVVESTAPVSGANLGCGSMRGSIATTGTSSAAARELATTCDLTVTSSSDGSGGSMSANVDPARRALPEDRKRKGRESNDTECQSEDVEFESADAKQRVRGSTSKKKSRAAEVHNLSERRRRDRINEKMRVLQELIPRCNKSDKASMLDEAIEYLKSLQMQVQMMSMGCNMVPMMFPGVQQYMPPMGMGMGMGMAMGMDMSMNRPMVPFPSVLPGSALPTSAAAAHLGSSFPMQAFHMPPVSVSDPSRIQSTNQSEPMLSSIASQNPNQPRLPNFPNPYQHYLSLHHTQIPLPQNQAVMQPNTSKANSSREIGNPENHQSG